MTTSLRRATRYGLSWLRADFLGHTICKVLGHRHPLVLHLWFQEDLADAFALPPGHDARQPVCTRCGGELA